MRPEILIERWRTPPAPPHPFRTGSSRHRAPTVRTAEAVYHRRVRLLALASVTCLALVLPGPPVDAVTTPGQSRATTTGGEYAAAVSDPVEDPYYPQRGDPRTDALHYGLRLHWSARDEVLRGRARIDLRAAEATQHLLLDLAHGLHVSSVVLDGVDASWTHDGAHLDVTAPATLPEDSRHILVVSYAGTPHPAYHAFTRPDARHLGWHTTRDGGAWTMQEPFGAFTWYPVNDQPSDKAFYDARISTPPGMVGVFNGEMVARHRTGHRQVTRWHLADPASSYLVTLGIGHYVKRTGTGPHGVPLTYWLPRDYTPVELRVARSLSPAMRWLEKHQGPYPFDQGGILATTGGSGMETQTLITLNRSILAHRGRAVVLHELAHHWYGDTVTPRTWKDLWLSEGWAMYAQIRWDAEHGGQSMREWRSELAAFDQELRDEDGPPGAYRKRHFAEGTVYYCAALMLDQLRTKIGPDAFADLWRTWPQEHRNGNADTEEFISWASARTGVNLRPFLTQWLTSPTTPPLAHD